jgi:hypothetical protein
MVMASEITRWARRRAYWHLAGTRRPARALVIGGIAAAVLAAGAVSAAANATKPPASGPLVLNGPSPRYEASMDYDGATGNLVLFGGETYGAVLGDTWALSGSTWTRLSPARSPQPRGDAMMAYDPATDNMVLFGGQTDNGQYLTGTWIWDGTTWTHLTPSVSPFPVLGGVMAYDSATGNMVLFGGNATTKLLDQTWTWNGTTWTQLSPPANPSAREGGVMAYDPATGQLLLYGGSGDDGVGRPGTCLHDTWSWNGTTWTELTPTAHPSVCYGASMAYDQATGQMVLFGGVQTLSGGKINVLSQTWTWNGSTWTQLAPAAHPSARYGASMAYDQATGQLMLFGGTAGTNVTYGNVWMWNGTTWTPNSP